VDKLRLGFAEWLRENEKQALECKAEQLLTESGHTIVWTPPSCPVLQPIKLFWTARKGHASGEYQNGRKMKKTVVANLRDGWWYGNKHKRSAQDAADYDILLEPSGCWKLAKHAIKMVNQRFIGMCPSLRGTMGNLLECCTYSLVGVVDTREFHIHLVALDSAHEGIICAHVNAIW
jgi:hypothetical protein